MVLTPMMWRVGLLSGQVGPYREYVTMGALVMKRGAVGQWGRRLFVNTPAAAEVRERDSNAARS
jgi:hypothetical protein